MKKLIKSFLFDTHKGNVILALYNNFILRIHSFFISDEKVIKQRHRERFGTALDFKRPVTLNEKINWLKLYDRTPLHTQCADKYAVREYVAHNIGEEYLIPLVFHSEKLSDVISKNFSDDLKFIIKTNHDSGGGIVIKNKTDADWKKIQNKLYVRLLKNHYYKGKEWQYKNIKKCIIAEEFLSDKDGNSPNDYKFICFHGKAEFVQVDMGRDIGHTRTVFTKDWEPLPLTYEYTRGENPDQPKNYAEMMALAEKLAKVFVFCRVDFYNIDGRIYFGEITFHPGSGRDRFSPHKWDKIFGDLLDLNKHPRMKTDSQ